MLRSAIFPALLAGALVPVPALSAPLPPTAYERLEIFATCAGRLEAMATRQHGFGEGNPEETRKLYRQFDEMVDLMLPHAVEEGMQSRQARDWRDRGWLEVSKHLSDADYSFDVRRAERARRALIRKISDCAAVLLP